MTSFGPSEVQNGLNIMNPSSSSEPQNELLSLQKTRSLAHLVRLEITDQEAHLFTDQLRQILGHVATLTQFSTDPASKEADVRIAFPSTGLREDQVVPFEVDAMGVSQVLGCAPSVGELGYRVPQVVGSGEES